MDYTKQTEWKRQNTRLYAIRLNKRTDADLIDRIEQKAQTEGIQGYLKRLVKEDIEKG